MTKNKFYFVCACGCGQVSEDLEKQYIRLRKSQKWYTKKCAEGKEIIKEFVGGVIVKEEDF